MQKRNQLANKRPRAKKRAVVVHASLILGWLTQADFDALAAARIPTSGRTAMGVHIGRKATKAHPYFYQRPAPYVATWTNYLGGAMVALGWKAATVAFRGGVLVARQASSARIKSADESNY